MQTSQNAANELEGVDNVTTKRTKFRKMMKGRNRGYATSGANLALGEFGLKAVEAGRINSRQIESARQAYTRHVKRQAKTWIRVFPDKPITKKPLETRMGKGKGGVEEWVMNIKPGRIILKWLVLARSWRARL